MSIPEVFTLVASLAKKRQLVVVLDEFQDILNLEDSHETLALLRSPEATSSVEETLKPE